MSSQGREFPGLDYLGLIVRLRMITARSKEVIHYHLPLEKHRLPGYSFSTGRHLRLCFRGRVLPASTGFTNQNI